MWPQPPEALLKELTPWLEQAPGKLAIACEHLGTGERWALGDAVMPAASLIKLHLAIAAYQAAEAGEFALLERVEVPALPDDDEAEFDNLGHAPEGTRSTWRKVIDRMLTESDNAATNALIERLGPEALAPLTRRLDLRHTALRRRMLDSVARQEGRENSTTASETASVFAALVRGELLDPIHTAELLGVLGQQRDRDKLAAGLPADVPFAHKTGELPGYRHDGGVVGFVPGGAAYVLVAMAEGDAQADRLLARVASVVHAYFSARGHELERANAWLTAEKARLIPDGRVAWDTLGLNWQAGVLTLAGTTTVPERLSSTPPVPLVSRARLLEARPGVVSVPCLQLRRKPGHAQELVSQVRLGDPLELLEDGPDWTLLRSPDGYVAYGKTNNLLALDDWQPTHTVAVPLTLADADDGTRFQLSAGSRLMAVGTRYSLPDGRCVKLPESHVLPLGRLGDIEELLPLARGFLGLPYLWGGTTGWGIDCSGLAQLCYFVMGVQLPRDADQQQEATEAVAAIGELLPGDLVFFPGHVGLYLGDHEFIHASAKAGMVTINSFDPGSPRFDLWLHENFTGGGRSPLRVISLAEPL